MTEDQLLGKILLDHLAWFAIRVVLCVLKCRDHARIHRLRIDWMKVVVLHDRAAGIISSCFSVELCEQRKEITS